MIFRVFNLFKLVPRANSFVFNYVVRFATPLSYTWQVLAGYLMFGTVTGIMMALFLDNVGGAWDNAKKYVEVKHWYHYMEM